MDEHRFSRLFPPELEQKILALLGLLDLTRTALVCRRFRDMSESLLFRHIAVWSVHFDDKGDAVHDLLHNWHKAIFCILDDVTLGRHVRFLEVNVPQLVGAVVDGRAAPMSADELHTVWSSMPGLIALSINGWIPDGQDLGLQNIDFPRLQRLRIDTPDRCIDFLQRHLPRLQHLSVVGITKIPFNWDMTVATSTLVHYEGPYPLLMQLLPDGAPTHSLESCALNGPSVPSTLVPLARHQHLKYISIDLDGLDRATILEIIRDCPPFTGVTSLKIVFDNRDDWNMETTSANPPWSQLMRPFPAALYIVLIVDMDYYDVVFERGLQWAKDISETCKDARVIVFKRIAFTRAGPGFDWVADDDAEEAIDASLNPSVVHAVPR
ncbi:hypothetical protein EXIGLDRAFT_726336 [Exidia glandulosa HHB12029]|uniref:F-box domain-containing protein n=1 Tax=Exidia glandulosa HHB12029 TaxID=1314781 RepID=A0A165DSI7_EXIGL|nr:hypothetical protein EXIGLDRAFT_726336 [Exidia glandulosa HHB12029]